MSADHEGVDGVLGADEVMRSRAGRVPDRSRPSVQASPSAPDSARGRLRCRVQRRCAGLDRSRSGAKDVSRPARAPPPTRTSHPLAHQGSTFLDYFNVLRRRKWIVLQAMIIVPLLAILITARQDDLWETQTKVALDREGLADALTGVTTDPGV